MKTTTRMLKKLLLLSAVILTSNQMIAQTLPDSAITQSVCIGIEDYEIVPNPTSTYSWSIIDQGTGFSPLVGQADISPITGDFYIQVDFTMVGVYKLSVLELDANSCEGATVDLIITVNPGSSSTDVQVACDTYTWGDGLTNGDGLIYTSTTNTPTFTATTVNGCDSVITLDLTINNSSTSTDVQVACDTYTWGDGLTNGDGNVYTSSTNTPTFTATTVNGCDSIITLDLTITASPNPFAGPNDTICAGLDYTLSSAGNTGAVGIITWTDASGSSLGFDDANILNPTYTPTAADVSAGFVILELQISAVAPCTAVSSFITITINAAPTPGPIFHN